METYRESPLWRRRGHDDGDLISDYNTCDSLLTIWSCDCRSRCPDTLLQLPPTSMAASPLPNNSVRYPFILCFSFVLPCFLFFIKEPGADDVCYMVIRVNFTFRIYVLSKIVCIWRQCTIMYIKKLTPSRKREGAMQQH